MLKYSYSHKRYHLGRKSLGGLGLWTMIFTRLGTHSTKISNWLLTTRNREVPEIEKSLRATMLQRRGVIIIGHLNVLVISLTIWLTTERSWALAWLLMELSLLSIRLHVYNKAQAAASVGAPVDYTALVASGLAWAVLLGYGSAAAILDGHTATMLLASINVSGILGGISSRNGATPRYAGMLILVAGVPFAVAAWFTDIPWLFLAGLEIFLLIMGIIMVTQQNNGVVRAMLRAQYANRQLSLRDALTGLLNRSALAQTLDLKLAKLHLDGLSEMSRFSVLCLDLDGFKAVNDTHGHGVGDLLLCEVARRFEKCVRPGDELFRIGGDEFTIVLDEAGSNETDEICERILSALRRPFLVGEVAMVGVGVSIGSKLSDRSDYDGSALMICADKALYEAKKTGRNRHVAYDNALKMKLTASALAGIVVTSEQVNLSRALAQS